MIRVCSACTCLISALTVYANAVPLCQEHREFRSRGLDPSLGWEADRVNYVQRIWWNERSRVVMAAAERNNAMLPHRDSSIACHGFGLKSRCASIIFLSRQNL